MLCTISLLTNFIDYFNNRYKNIAELLINNGANLDLQNGNWEVVSTVLGVLREDFINNPESWENKTLADFLEALATYTEDIQGYYNNMNANINAVTPAWSTFADIFKGVKLYY